MQPNEFNTLRTSWDDRKETEKALKTQEQQAGEQQAQSDALYCATFDLDIKNPNEKGGL